MTPTTQGVDRVDMSTPSTHPDENKNPKKPRNINKRSNRGRENSRRPGVDCPPRPPLSVETTGTETKTTNQAREALTDALANLNTPTPCANDNRWISDNPDERAHAATRCTHCPIIRECANAGQHEKFAVWGGTDRTPKPPRRPTNERKTT